MGVHKTVGGPRECCVVACTVTQKLVREPRQVNGDEDSSLTNPSKLVSRSQTLTPGIHCVRAWHCVESLPIRETGK